MVDNVSEKNRAYRRRGGVWEYKDGDTWTIKPKLEKFAKKRNNSWSRLLVLGKQRAHHPVENVIATYAAPPCLWGKGEARE